MISTAVLLRGAALPDSYARLCTSSSDTLLAGPADGGFASSVRHGGTDSEQLSVSAATRPSLLTLLFQNVSYTMFNAEAPQRAFLLLSVAR